MIPSGKWEEVLHLSILKPFFVSSLLSSAYCSKASHVAKFRLQEWRNGFHFAVREVQSPTTEGMLQGDVSNRGPSLKSSLAVAEMKALEADRMGVSGHTLLSAADCFCHAGQLHSWQLSKLQLPIRVVGIISLGTLDFKRVSAKKTHGPHIAVLSTQKELNWGSLFPFSDEVFDSPFLSSLSLVYPNFDLTIFAFTSYLFLYLCPERHFPPRLFFCQTASCLYPDQGTPKNTISSSDLSFRLSWLFLPRYHPHPHIILPRTVYLFPPLGWAPGGVWTILTFLSLGLDSEHGAE